MLRHYWWLGVHCNGQPSFKPIPSKTSCKYNNHKINSYFVIFLTNFEEPPPTHTRAYLWNCFQVCIVHVHGGVCVCLCVSVCICICVCMKNCLCMYMFTCVWRRCATVPSKPRCLILKEWHLSCKSSFLRAKWLFNWPLDCLPLSLNSLHTPACTRIYTHIHTHTHIYIYIHTHTHTHTQIPISLIFFYRIDSEDESTVISMCKTLETSTVCTSFEWEIGLCLCLFGRQFLFVIRPLSH